MPEHPSGLEKRVDALEALVAALTAEVAALSEWRGITHASLMVCNQKYVKTTRSKNG